MTTEKKPIGRPRKTDVVSNKKGNKNWAALAKDSGEYFLKSLGAIILAVLAMALTATAWLASGLHIGFGWLSENCFHGARQLDIRLTKIRWYKSEVKK